LFSVLVDITIFPNITQDLFLSCIYGGLMLGVGLGMVFMGGGSTGGTDMVAKIINHYRPKQAIGRMMLLVDFFVLLATAIIFSWELGLYALAAVIVCAYVMDLLLQGRADSYAFWIVTKKPDQMAKEIFTRVDRGLTRIDAKGMYTDASLAMLLCVVGTRGEYQQIRRIVYEVDANSFVIVSKVNEVIGSGFLPHGSK
ncbi:MAG: YitT family protein, partial [Sporomusa sp.]